MNEFSRPLAGCKVALSISESDDSADRGFPGWQVNRVTLQAVAALFGQGASIFFGHDWRDDGVMQAVHGFAQQVQAPLPLTRAETKSELQPMLVNCLAWPDEPYLDEEELERLAPTLRVDQIGLPEELKATGEALPKERESRTYKYLRARGLTVLRHRLTEMADARICIGGRCSSFEGRYSGVLEEALLTLRLNKPLFISGLLGGVAGRIIRAIEADASVLDVAAEMAQPNLFRDPPVAELDRTTLEDRQVNAIAALEEFGRAGKRQLAEGNGLTEEQNKELFQTPSVDRVVSLILQGLSRCAKRHNA